jgi:S-adenosylmethionine:tRNA ribosyltransferase-isomerase
MTAALPARTETARSEHQLNGWDFQLPRSLEAGEPPEARGLARDAVRLLVSERASDRAIHAGFRDLLKFLDPGDVLAINTSATLNAALLATRADGELLELHLSTRVPPPRRQAEAGPYLAAGANGGLALEHWVVELRRPGPKGSEPRYGLCAGETIALPAGATATLRAPYRAPADGRVRLWTATLALPLALRAYLDRHGFPIRYSYVRERWPLASYQNVYATEPGSAEMPSAGRGFTPELITRLVARGVQFAPLVLHTGVASLEDHEPPYEEYYRVPEPSAALVNAARAAGRRVIAVGTTVVRALETAADARGRVQARAGWTGLVISPARGLRAVTGLLTGLHEPRSSHLAMLEALAGPAQVRRAYAAALDEGYLWHEFGDLHLLL